METAEVLTELRKGLRLFRAMERAEELAVWYEGLEQNVRETQQAIEQAKAELERASGTAASEIANWKAKITAERARAQRATEAADQAGKDIVETATREAAELLAKAKVDTAHLQSLAAETIASMETAEARRAAIENETAELSARLEGIRAAIAKYV